MGESAWNALVAAEVTAALERYKGDPAAATALFDAVLAGDPKVRAAWAKAVARGDPAQVVRTKAWKQGVKKARRQLYAELRRFVKADVDLADLAAQLRGLPPQANDIALRDAILAGHASTAERGPAASWGPLWEAWSPHLHGAQRLLDVGGGVFALGVPADRLGIARLHVLERDPGCVAALQAWGARHPWLSAETWALEQGVSHLEGRFDVALLLKVLPLFARQERSHVEALQTLPADRWIVSGSTEALARKRDISRREAATLDRTLQALGKRVVDRFVVGTELFVVAC